MQKVLFSFALFCWLSSGQAQQTVGVFVNGPQAFPGYTLFTPSSSKLTYLIDNCGRLIHQWLSDFAPGQSVYLLNDGSILRTARISSTFHGGGTGGRIEKISWENELVWYYVYSSPNYHQHHDIEPLPNGNVLILAWERKSQADAIAFGRNPSNVPAQGLWPDHIVEVSPLKETGGEIIWEWHAWNHLIQDFDSTKAHYGNVADHPELIDLNYTSGIGSTSISDWLHCNSIDYNPTLDQIMISVYNFSEIWIIDHSTSSEEASGHTGGKSGQGGDLLYRWGNPQAYKRGGITDRIFNGQHDARWIESGFPGAGQVSVYNNTHGNGADAYSSADFFLPALDSSGGYVLVQGEPFGPTALSWTFDGMPGDVFYSSRLSSAQRLLNGNTLICVGNMGRFIETTIAGEIVWEYVSPVSGNIIVSQGEVPVINDIFRAERFDLDFMGFNGRSLTPGVPLELNPLPTECYDTLISGQLMTTSLSLDIMPNPVAGTIYLINPEMRSVCLNIFAGGQLIEKHDRMSRERTELNTDHWPPGLVVFVCTDLISGKTQVMKLLKL